MGVTYKIRPRDLLQGRLHLFNTSMVGKVGFLLWLLLPFMVSGFLLHLLRGTNPIAHPLAVLKYRGQGALIGWLVGSSAPYVLAALSDMVNSVSITSRGFTVATRSVSGKATVLWQRTKAVEENAHYIHLRRFWYVLSIPKDAFSSPAEAESFFALALAYWREAKGIVSPPAVDVSGVWPPAPCAMDAQGPGGKP